MMGTKRILLATCVLAGSFVVGGFVLGNIAHAQDEVFATVVQDTYIRHAVPDAVYGFDAEMLSGNETIANNWRTDALIEFELPPAPAGQAVESARLELYNHHLEWANRGNADFGVTAVYFEWFEDFDSWDSLDADFADYGDTVYDVAHFEGVNPPHGTREDVFPEEWKEWDVTELVQSWYDGTIENYGLAVIGMYNLGEPELGGGEGVLFPRFRTKDYVDDTQHPVLAITFGEGGGGINLQPGDANQDLSFDQLDIVQVSIAAKYLSGEAATWGEGDWNGAPGGEPGSPPAGNGLFDQLDIIAALSAGKYLTGPYAALAPNGTVDDEQTSLVYDPTTGALRVDAPASTQLTSIFVTSAGNNFVGDKPPVLDGPFDSFAADNIFKSTIGSSFGDIDFGQVLPAALSEADVLADLSASGSLNGGGGLGDVDLVYIPEPSSIMLMVLALAVLLSTAKRKAGGAR